MTEGNYSVTAVVFNSEGVSSDPSNVGAFELDKTAPGEDDNDTITVPQITIPEATGDGVIEPTEAVDGTTVVLDIPESSEAGDIVTLTVTQPDGTEVVVTEAVLTN